MRQRIETLRRRYWQLRSRYRREWRLVKFRVTHRGRDHFCNICGWWGSQFFDTPDGPNGTCPACLSLPRHRLLKAVLEERSEPRPGSRILHVCPKGERGLARWFRRLSRTYLSIDKGGIWNDFSEGGAMLPMDLTKLAFADGSFDFVMCSHVLECIPDDRAAIGEIYRVLAPGGTAALQVQIYGEISRRVDNPSADDYFHAWQPGLDYFTRYEEAGFQVELYKNADNAELMKLPRKKLVPICTKPLDTGQ